MDKPEWETARSDSPDKTGPGGGTGENVIDNAIDSATEVAPAAYWDGRYGESERMWSGRPNAALVDVMNSLQDLDRLGTALDLGCGEGADAIWLAQQGWRVTGVDISATAIARAEAAAHAAGIGVRPGAIGSGAGKKAGTDGLSTASAEFIVADLTAWDEPRTFDLVTASFLHSRITFSRAEVLRRAAGRVSAGGHLVIISHAQMPPWAGCKHGHESDQHTHEHESHESGGREDEFLTVDEEIAQLALDREDWNLAIGETRNRDAEGPDGTRTVLQDNVIVLRRA